MHSLMYRCGIHQHIVVYTTIAATISQCTLHIVSETYTSYTYIVHMLLSTNV